MGVVLFGGMALHALAPPLEAVEFFGNESAGDVQIDNVIEGVSFHDQSTAGNATINNSFSGFTFFNDQSTAGNALIRNENGGVTFFSDQSSAGNALIVSGEEGATVFLGNSDGGTARLVTESGGFVDFSEAQGPAGDARIGVGSIAGNGTFNLGSATLITGRNNLDTLVNGSLNGDVDGSLVKVGSGTLSIRGENANSLGSSIVVQGGLINFDVGDSLGTGSIVLDGGGLQWGDSSTFDISPRLAELGAAGATFDTNGNDVSLAAAISGSGSLTKTGAGVLELLAPASYGGGTLVQAGTLRQGGSGAFVGGGAYTLDGGVLDLNGIDLNMSVLSGSGGEVVLGGALLTLEQSGDSRFAGSILGSGAFIKDGAGVLELTGSHAIDGTTQVRGGTLAVNGSLLSAIQVQDGATLGGTGSVGDVLIASGGILAPGNSIGTLNVEGDLVFSPGSVYQVETDAAGNADQVLVSGLASLAGSVQVLAENGTYAPSTRYNILSAGQLSGQFDSVSSNLAFLDPSLSYADNAVTLTLTRNDTSFSSLARTPNQLAFARAAESLSEDNEVYRTLLDLGEDEVADTFNKLSGDAHASFASALAFDDINLLRAPLGNLRRNLASPERALPYWVQVGGGRQRIEDDGNAGEVIQHHEGMLLGGDWPAFGDWRLGGAFGYGQERLDVDSRDAKADADSYRYALYGGRDFPLPEGTLKLFGGGGYSQHQIDSRRNVSLIDGPEHLTRQYDVSTTQGFGELAWHLKFDEPAYVEPFIGLLLIEQRSDSFAEKGGAAALSAGSQRNELLSSSLGVRGQQLFQLAQRDLLLNGSLTWRQLNGDLQPELELQLQGGDRFKVLGTELPRNSFLVELNLDYSITPNVVVDIDYNGVFSDSSQANNIAFNLRWKM